MCGIGGIAKFKGSIEIKPTLEKMGSIQSHRGKDHFGIWTNKHVGLFHNRLSIIDLSPAGNQPMVDNDSQVMISFNGEIFNYLRLKEELCAAGVQFQSKSDTEVLLKAYLHWGLDFLQKIDGMFAFAIFDPNRNKVLLARDHAGIKPLYFVKNENFFAFSSECKPLVLADLTTPEIDPHGLKDYLYLQLYLDDHTLFKNIKQLQPGYFAEIDLNESQVKIQRYWDMPSTKETKMSYDDVVSQLRLVLDQSITDWCLSDTPIASYLSGGVDSSLVTCVAAQKINPKLQDRLITLSSLFDDKNTEDERFFSDIVAKHIHSDHKRIFFKTEELVAAHESLIYQLDYPIAGWAAPAFVMSQHCKKYANVVLAGHGGDEVFGGYPKTLAAYTSRLLTEGYLGNGSTLKTEVFQSFFGFEDQAKSILSGTLFKDDYHFIKHLFDRTSSYWVNVNNRFKKETENYDPFARLLEIFNQRSDSFFRKLLYLDFKILLPGLLHVEDRASMNSTLESRTPILSRQVLEFAAHIPSELLIARGLKTVLKDAATQWVPDTITINKKKSGTVYPAKNLFENELRSKFENEYQELWKHCVFQGKASDIKLFQNKNINQRDTWALWSLGSWLKHFQN